MGIEGFRMSWFETLKGDCGAEKSDPMARVTTTASTGQDEEAAKRTEDKEAGLAMLRERNKDNRKKLNQPVEKLIEWVEG